MQLWAENIRDLSLKKTKNITNLFIPTVWPVVYFWAKKSDNIYIYIYIVTMHHDARKIKLINDNKIIFKLTTIHLYKSKR